MENLAGDDDGDGEADLLCDHLRLSVVKMAIAEGRALPLLLFLLAWLALASVDRFLFLHAAYAVLVCAGRKAGMEVAETVVACVADLALRAQVCLHGFAFSCICSSQLSLPVTNPHLVNCKLTAAIFVALVVLASLSVLSHLRPHRTLCDGLRPTANSSV
jgi:hypothetical protein